MKLISYSINGNDSFGIVKGDGVVNLGRRIKSRSLREAIANEPDPLAAHAGDSVDHPLSEIRFLPPIPDLGLLIRSEEHTSELQSLMRITYAVFGLKNTRHL